MKLIGLITTVVVLGAIYLFMVKPILDTTNDAFDSVNNAFEDAGFDDIDVSTLQNGDFSEIQQQISDTDLNSNTAKKLSRCIERVQPDADKIQDCVEKFT